MTDSKLRVTSAKMCIGGNKALNQDACFDKVSTGSTAVTKGHLFCVADGVSSSKVSAEASEYCVSQLSHDYFHSPDSWSAKSSLLRSTEAINTHLYRKGRRSDTRYYPDQGYVTTMSALVLKSQTAHICHIGDSRIYLFRDGTLEQLTVDNVLLTSDKQSHLTKAIGYEEHVQASYQTLSIQQNDVFLLLTDGITETLCDKHLEQQLQRIHTNELSLEQCLSKLLATALENNATDNLTAMLVQVQTLPNANSTELVEKLASQNVLMQQEAGASIDSYTINRVVHISNRSYAYLATDKDTGDTVFLKTPSIEQKDNHRFIERFVLEQWISQRVSSPNLGTYHGDKPGKSYCYIVTDFIDGQTLQQWMLDNPTPNLETVRNIAEQIGLALRALHRQEIIHQDLRPANIMIDANGKVTVIDLGAASVAGLEDIASPLLEETVLGTSQYSAPEYYIGNTGSASSDIFSLAVIVYQMLSGQLPYRSDVARIRTPRELNKLKYRPLHTFDSEIPMWLDSTLETALNPQGHLRHQDVDEFIHDLRHPNAKYMRQQKRPLIQRDPVRFWQAISAMLLLTLLFSISWN